MLNLFHKARAGEEEAFPVGNGWKWLVLCSIDLGCLLHENSAGWTWHRVWLMSAPQVLVVRCVDFPSDAGLSNKSRDSQILWQFERGK